MNATDPFAQFKANQRESWGLFAPLQTITTAPAALLVEFAHIKTNDRVLDVACGTGVVAVTAARRGARVSALDLSPALLEHARANSRIAGVDVSYTEGDVEALPYENATFDIVVSQFGHMFAPRPEVAVSEMLRVLKPGGRIAFSTWPPELFTGRMFSLIGRYLPPPQGVAPPPLWGDPNVVRERLGASVKDLQFTREVLLNPSLSPTHTRQSLDATAAPNIKIRENLSRENPARLAEYERELESLIAEYTQNNVLRQHFLMTRATKV